MFTPEKANFFRISFFRRKGAPSDGMPGVRSIWQGLDVLYSLLAYRNYLV